MDRVEKLIFQKKLQKYASNPVSGMVNPYASLTQDPNDPNKRKSNTNSFGINKTVGGAALGLGAAGYGAKKLYDYGKELGGEGVFDSIKKGLPEAGNKLKEFGGKAKEWGTKAMEFFKKKP